jgi:prefoldin subunit 5
VADPETERWIGELAQLRREISELRSEQQELARAVQELARTFRALALHFGIASEPYPKAKGSAPPRESPGFA